MSSRYLSLSAAGFAATAIGFGPARMGFGLFVPQIRQSFELSTTMVGFVSSLGFTGYLAGLLVAQGLLSRRGPEAPVLVGLTAATLGMALVAAAPALPVLAAGVFLAAMSAGCAWTPFNDAVNRAVSEPWRPAALSKISTGTSVGIAGAGLLGIAAALTGLGWRTCWGAFAIASGLVLLGNRMALRDVEPATERLSRHALISLLRAEAVPLLAVGFAFGTTSAVFISFAADHLTSAGGVPGLPLAATPGRSLRSTAFSASPGC